MFLIILLVNRILSRHNKCFLLILIRDNNFGNNYKKIIDYAPLVKNVN